MKFAFLDLEVDVGEAYDLLGGELGVQQWIIDADEGPSACWVGFKKRYDEIIKDRKSVV